MFKGHYENWRLSRIAGIKKYLKSDFLKNKTMLELGCGHGDIGNIFNDLGCKVTCSDAREEHINVVNKKYPHLDTEVIDCDNIKLQKKYDIILHWGLLYHLNEIDMHLKIVSENCNYMFLETEVLDHEDDTCVKTNEKGFDQAFNNIGNRSTQKRIENILKNNNFNYKLIKDSILNSSFHRYDWEIKNTKKWKHGLRRFWICWKNEQECPIKEVTQVTDVTVTNNI